MINDGLDLIDYVFTVVTNSISAIVNHLSAAADILWSWMVHAADTVGGWITAAAYWWWDNVISPAIGLVHDIVNYVSDALSYAIGLVSAGLDWAINNLVVPALNWIENAVNTVGGWISDAVNAFYHDVILPIWGDVQHLLDAANDLWQWAFNFADSLLHGVEKAWDWVVWFGEHTFDDLRALFGDFEQGQGLDAIVNAVKSDYDDTAAMLDRVASWLS